MEDITKLSHIELMKDKHESLADIRLCEIAIEAGYTRYGEDGSNSVQERLEVNQGIVRKIDAELARRLAAAAPAA